jgi:hypothetical protein
VFTAKNSYEPVRFDYATNLDLGTSAHLLKGKLQGPFCDKFRPMWCQRNTRMSWAPSAVSPTTSGKIDHRFESGKRGLANRNNELASRRDGGIIVAVFEVKKKIPE